MLCSEEGIRGWALSGASKPPLWVSHPYEGRGGEQREFFVSGAACPVEAREEEAELSKALPAGSWRPRAMCWPCPRATVPEFLQRRRGSLGLPSLWGPRDEKGFASLLALPVGA